MIKTRTKIPKFRSDAEAAAFFDTHDSTEFQTELMPVHLEFPKPRHLLISLNFKQMDRLRKIAKKAGTQTDRLVHKWITEKLSKTTL